jgi:serine protease Do
MVRMCRYWVFSAAFLGLLLFSSGQAHAQKKRGGGGKDISSPFTRTNPKFLEAFRDVVAPASKSTVRIVCDGKDTALGFVIEPDGWILTKANDLKGDVECRLPGGKLHEAVIVGIHKQHDLALLKIDAAGLTPVTLVDSKSVPVGNWVALPGPAADPVAVGVVSVATRDVPNKGGPISVPGNNSGYLGVILDNGEGGVKVVQVIPKTPAFEAGIKDNDVILRLQGKSALDPDTFMEMMSHQKAGDVVTLKVRRGDEELEFKPKLTKRPFNRGDFQNTMGSELSSRRTGYPTILQHDSVVKPVDCGGPIVDLDGKVIGINICRAGRTESWAVPSEAIRPLLAELKSGKLAPPPVTQERIDELQKAADKARVELEKIKQGVKSAQADVQAAGAQKDVAEANLTRLKSLLEKLQSEVGTAEKRVNATSTALEKAKAKLKKFEDQKKANPEKKDAGAAADRLLDLMARRLALMPQVAQAKWNAGLPIEDAKREEAILSRLTAEGAKHGLDADFTRRFFRRAA